jgi:hypothetical protein
VNYAAGSECTVNGLEQSKNYQVEVKTRDYAGNYSIGNPVISVYVTGLPGSKNNIPANFKLYQNYPNPFNPTTTISYYLPINAFVIIKIFDMNGQEVIEFKRGTQLTGRHKVDWDGKDQQGNDVASGVYIYQMVLSNNIYAKKMILIH